MIELINSIKKDIQNSRIRSSSTYRNIILSYLAILAISAISGIILIQQTKIALSNEMFRANLASMNQMKNQIDNELMRIEEICTQQSMDSTVIGFIYSQNRNDLTTKKQRHIDTVNIVKSLRNAAISNRFVETLFLITLKDDIMITNYGKYTVNEFINAKYPGQNMIDDTEFSMTIAETNYKKYSVITPTSNLNNYNQSGSDNTPVFKDLYFSYALPLGTRIKDAVLGVRVNNIEIRKIIKDYEWLPEAHVILIDEFNNTIGLTDSKLKQAAQSAPWNVIESEKAFRWTYENDEYFILTVNSTVNLWRYGIIVPSNVYLEPLVSSMKIYFFELLLLMVMGITMAVFLSNLQYRPIKRLANIIKPNKICKEKSYNEFKDIERAFSAVFTENIELSQLNSLQKSMLKNQQLIGVLFGIISEEYEITEVLRNNGMAVRFSRFAAILLSKKFNNRAFMAKDIDLLSATGILQNELLKIDFDSINIENAKEKCILVNFSEKINELDLYQLCLSFAEKYDFFDIYLISISNVISSPEDIHSAYLEAQEVLEYQLAQNKNDVLIASQLPADNETDSRVSISPENKTDKETIVAEAIALIQQQYTNVMLSVSSIADEIGISQVMLSRAFKQTMDIGALEFINKLRLKVAKKLISDTDISLHDIACKVGYTNNVTFIRVFKKYEGVTPSKFRSIMSKKTNSELC